MNKLRIASIAGDGIGKEVMPVGLAVLDTVARRCGIDVEVDEFDFASCDYHAKHGQMMPADWKDRIGGHDAILFGAGGLAGNGAGPCLAMGVADQVQARIRPICESAPGAVDARHPFAVGRPRGPAAGAGCHRHVDRAREHRRRVFGGGRAHVRRQRTRDRDAADDPVAHRCRPGAEVRFRTGGFTAEGETDLGHQEQTASPSPCPTGTNASKRWPRRIRRWRSTASTSTS